MHLTFLPICVLALQYAVQGQLNWISGSSPSMFCNAALGSLSHRDLATMLCGIQNGNASCPTGFCCDQYGQCGIGREHCDAPYCQFEYASACDANEVPTGFNTSSVSRPQLGSVPYGGSGVRNCTVPGTVALTFDDGPYIYTADLLDMLKAASIPATFFITGNNFNKHQINNKSTPYPEVIRRMHHEGHQIGSHTWSHQSLENITHAERLDQMIKNEIAIHDILGFIPTYMRPPYDECKNGRSNCQTDIRNLGYHLINYNLDTKDYIDDTPSLIQVTKDNVSQIIGASDTSKQAFILYAHDIYNMTVHNLTAALISTVKQKGYKFVTIGECLNDPRYNWYRNVTTGDAVTESIVFGSNTVAVNNSTSSSVATPSSKSSADALNAVAYPESRATLAMIVLTAVALLTVV